MNTDGQMKSFATMNNILAKGKRGECLLGTKIHENYCVLCVRVCVRFLFSLHFALVHQTITGNLIHIRTAHVTVHGQCGELDLISGIIG